MTTKARTESDEFVTGLLALTAPHRRGALAALRRCRGHRPGEVAAADAVFFAALPAAVPDSRVDAYWLVAGLFAQEQAGNTKVADGAASAVAQPDLGATLRGIAGNEAKAGGADRRLRRLLDAKSDELEPHLRGVIALAGSSGLPIHWRRLLDDLLRWNDPHRSVQRQWARSYWGLPKEPAATERDSTPISTTTED